MWRKRRPRRRPRCPCEPARSSAERATRRRRPTTQALDLDVDTVAASSATGIYLREADGGRSDHGGHGGRGERGHRGRGAERLRFEHDGRVARPARRDALEDLTTTSNGPIKLVAEAGTITIDGGAATADGGVSATARATCCWKPAAPIERRDRGRHGDQRHGAHHAGRGPARGRERGGDRQRRRGHGVLLSGEDTDIDAARDHGRRRHAGRSGRRHPPDGSDQQHRRRHRSDRRSGRGPVGHGDITTTSGDVLVQATAGSWTMDGDAPRSRRGRRRRAGPGGRRTSRWA